MTKFSFEVPTAHLEYFDDLQDFYFTLAHLYDDERYLNFFQERQNTKELWLDNSYNELLKATDIQSMRTIAELVRPNRVISPDAPAWSKEVIAFEFHEAQKYFTREQLIVVVSSLDMRLYLQQLRAEHYAISYWVRPKIEEQLQQMLPAHFLGLLSPREIREFRPPSCDTSMPIKLALQDKNLSDWIAEGCLHIYTHQLGIAGNDFFSARMTKRQLVLARNNIVDLKEMCNG